MAKFYILGRYTDKGLGGFVNNPEQIEKLLRQPAAKTGYAGPWLKLLLIKQLLQEWLQFQVGQ